VVEREERVGRLRVERAGSSVPVATATSVWSSIAVMPTLAENAIASSALRFLSPKVCRTRR
jgi:hypothetical protein